MNEVTEYHHGNSLLPALLMLLVAFLLKDGFSRGSSEDLIWILAPTAGIVEWLSGISFVHEPWIGYVSLEPKIAIVPACAGINFLIIAFCMSACHGILRLRSEAEKWGWVVASLVCAFGVTLWVNSLRILLAIRLYEIQTEDYWLTQAQLHRIEGICIYLLGLLFLYACVRGMTRFWLRHSAKPASPVAHCKKAEPHTPILRWMGMSHIPLSWYLMLTLGVPLLNGAATRHTQFQEHATVVISTSLLIWLAVTLIRWIVLRVTGGLDQPANGFQNGILLRHRASESNR